MAKRKTAVQPTEETPQTDVPVSDVNNEPSAAPPQNGEPNRPVHVVSVIVQKDTYVQASVWERTVQTKDSTFVTHEVSVRKRYKNGNGEWASAHNFRASELYAVEYVVRKAEEWILDRRAEQCPF